MPLYHANIPQYDDVLNNNKKKKKSICWNLLNLEVIFQSVRHK